jgi:hypothetical protein
MGFRKDERVYIFICIKELNPMIHKYLFILVLSLISICNSCAFENREELVFDDSLDTWGETTEIEPEFYAAEDVSPEAIALTKQYYKIAAENWGNYGPLEFWLVGKNEDAASKLDKEYCALRTQKSPGIPAEHCINRGHNFVTYAKEGNAGLNLRRNNYEEWSGFLITMASKNPSPTEDDYEPVLLHEYFHVYQQAHIYTRDESEREELAKKNPWWLEGGAEYMGQLLYSKQEGVKGGYFKEVMEWKLQSIKDLRKGQRIEDIPYGPDARLAYDLGTWFIAFLIHRSSEEAYRVDFFQDLNDLGFEESFKKNFGSSSEAMLDEFHEVFLPMSNQDKLAILPQ